MGKRSFCLLLAKHRIEMKSVGAGLWEYRIFDEQGDYVKAGLCAKAEECRQRVRAIVRQLLGETFLSEKHWPPEDWELDGVE